MKKFCQTKKSARLDSRKRPLVDARRGFSLVESLIAVFIFSFVAIMLTGSFSGFLKRYAAAKKSQRSSESAQYVMNLMVKTIRNSTLPSAPATFTNLSQIRIFDNSRGLCVYYRYQGAGIAGKLQTASSPGADINACPVVATSAYSDLTVAGDFVGFGFSGVPSVAGTGIGKVVINAEVIGGDASRIQTAVSLRQ